MKSRLFQELSGIDAVKTAHLAGTKKVFLSSSDTRSDLTQFAYGELDVAEQVESHSHPTMEEFFFFLEGSGIFVIDKNEFKLQKDVFVYVPADTPHHLVNTGNDKLKFIYFGVAI